MCSVPSIRWMAATCSTFDFHTHPNPDCPVGGHIHEVLDGELADAQAALEHRLAQTTLADLLKRLN